jgi:putative endonuclease
MTWRGLIIHGADRRFGVVKTYYVFIMTNHSRTLYVGMTNDLARRVAEHREGSLPGFTKRYCITQLVHFEEFRDVRDAIEREKQIKSWRRGKKIELIESVNPGWEDLHVVF